MLGDGCGCVGVASALWNRSVLIRSGVGGIDRYRTHLISSGGEGGFVRYRSVKSILASINPPLQILDPRTIGFSHNP